MIPNWDPVSQAKVHVALQLLANTVSGDDPCVRHPREVDPVRHTQSARPQWDRCPPRTAIAYLHAVPRKGRTHTPSTSVGHVPVDASRSLSV